MDKKLLLGVIPVMLSVMLLLTAGTAVAQPTIDGTISPGEWDAYYLGTSVTTWQGGMAVDVYGYADATHLYVAYKADITQPGWPTACLLNINANFYFKTPQSASWPDEGYTILEMVFPRVMQTDGSGWVDIGTPTANGIVAGYTDMYSVSYEDAVSGAAGAHMAEFKIPLSLLTYAGTDGLIALTGQYWQYDWPTTPFYVTLPKPTKADVLSGNDVPGKGIFNAPGLQKLIPNWNYANGTGN